MNNACFINTDVPNTQRDEYLFMHHNATDNITYRYMAHRTDGRMFESLDRSCSFSQNVKNIPLALEAGRRWNWSKEKLALYLVTG